MASSKCYEITSNSRYQIKIASEKAKTEWKKQLRRLVKGRISEELEFNDINRDVGYEITHFACVTSYWIIIDTETGQAFPFNNYYDEVSEEDKEAWLEPHVRAWNNFYLEIVSFFIRRPDEMYIGTPP